MLMIIRLRINNLFESTILKILKMYHPHPSLVFKAANTIMHFRPTLDKVEELSFVCIFSKSIYKLTILREMLPYPQSVWPEGYQSMSLRMTTLKKLVPPESLEVDSILIKKQVQKCRYFLQQLFEEITNELAYQGTWHYLEYIICCETLKHYDDFMLKQENHNLNEAIEYLINKHNEVKETSKETLLYLTDMTERCLEKAGINAWVQMKTAIRFAEVSQQARLDQNNYRLNEKEQAVQKAIAKSVFDMDEENIISNEIESHLLNSTSSLQKKLESWTNRYNQEIDSLDVALLQIKSKLEEQRQQQETLLGQFNTRQELLDEMQQEADERDHQLNLKRLQSRAAAIIQSWWRNILFWRGIRRRMKMKKLSVKPGKNKNIKMNKNKRKK